MTPGVKEEIKSKTVLLKDPKLRTQSLSQSVKVLPDSDVMRVKNKTALLKRGV